MKRLLFGLGWLLLLSTAGAAALALLGWAATGTTPALSPRQLAGGATLGLSVYLFLLLFGRLPGLRAGGVLAEWGPAQAVVSLLGFIGALAAGGFACTNILIVGNLLLGAAQAGWHADPGGEPALLAMAFGGEAAAALWICWYLGRAGAGRLADGSPGGIAWRPASRTAYGVAALCAAAIIGIVTVLFTLIPPNLKALDDLPAARLFEASGWAMAALLLLVMVIGPVVEELVFRGAAFAGLARRYGPVWAGVITTLLFVALHAEEKLHYLPGFIDVGLMAAAACWLRVRYGSIRPGILLHILYNSGLLFAAGLTH